MRKSIMELKTNFDKVVQEYQKNHPNSLDLGKDHCISCGTCCWTNPCTLSKDDVIRISEYIGISVIRFFYFYCLLEYYSVQDDDRFVIKLIRHNQKDVSGGMIHEYRQWDIDTPCIFYIKDKCLLHPVKPEEGINCKCWENRSKRYKPYIWRELDLRIFYKEESDTSEKK